MSYTADTLLTKIKQKAMMPDSQVTYTDAVLLQLADEEILNTIMPMLIAAQNDFYTVYTDYAAATSVNIPTRALGMKIVDVVEVGTDGTEYDIPFIDSLDEGVDGFYFRQNKVHFNFTPTRTIRVYYNIRPNELVATTSAASVTSVVGTTVNVDAIPTSFTSGLTYDFVNNNPGYETLLMDQSVSSVGSTDLTLSFSPSITLAAGTYVSVAGYSPVVQIPKELQGALEWKVVSAVLATMGDYNGSQAAEVKAEKAMQAGLSMLDPRIDKGTRKIIYDQSPLRNNNRTLVWAKE